MNDFLGEMKLQRKVAVRLGTLADEQARYILKPDILKHLCNGRKSWEDITEDDFILDVRQKGVDMKIGLDIASMAYKKQVDRIILISGDSDFVPAAKLARREGIDFILDPMQAKIKDDLTEEEVKIYKRGRNAKAITRAKNASMSDYRVATGFEALMGWLYLTKQSDRMMELIKMAVSRFKNNEENKRG